MKRSLIIITVTLVIIGCNYAGKKTEEVSQSKNNDVVQVPTENKPCNVNVLFTNAHE